MLEELLAILACPRSKKPLQMASAEILLKINQAISQGSCKTIAGEPVSEQLEAALYEPQAKILYQVREGIPILIYDNAIEIR